MKTMKTMRTLNTLTISFAFTFTRLFFLYLAPLIPLSFKKKSFKFLFLHLFHRVGQQSNDTHSSYGKHDFCIFSLSWGVVKVAQFWFISQQRELVTSHSVVLSLSHFEIWKSSRSMFSLRDLLIQIIQSLLSLFRPHFSRFCDLFHL